jgi:hypothetical protein
VDFLLLLFLHDWTKEKTRITSQELHAAHPNDRRGKGTARSGCQFQEPGNLYLGQIGTCDAGQEDVGQKVARERDSSPGSFSLPFNDLWGLGRDFSRARFGINQIDRRRRESGRKKAARGRCEKRHLILLAAILLCHFLA